ncbi:hypothetical protein ACGFOM_16865 [Streptomyces sp. NPDC048594]|uniref:hypothetical protein n=1 Tax=Streptomyces sp. NPDC048594 TaxID=3365575 RepID=UPI003714E526
MNGTAVVISGIALVISLCSLYRSVRNDRLDITLRLHESLVDPKLQTGRKVLHEMRDVESLSTTTSDCRQHGPAVARMLAA